MTNKDKPGPGWTREDVIAETKAKLATLDAAPTLPDLQGEVVGALKAYDDACDRCPGSGGRPLPDACPKCFATTAQSCGIEVRASDLFIGTVRALLAKLESQPHD